MPFSPRGIEQSLVLPPRWPLILYTGTLYLSKHNCITPIRSSFQRVERFSNLSKEKGITAIRSYFNQLKDSTSIVLMLFVGGSWTIWVFGLKWWRRDPGTQIKLLPFFSSVPVAAILDFKMAAIFSIFWPTSQFLSPKWCQNDGNTNVCNIITFLESYWSFLFWRPSWISKWPTFSTYFGLYFNFRAPRELKMVVIPMLMMLRDVIRALGKLLVVVFLAAI